MLEQYEGSENLLSEDLYCRGTALDGKFLCAVMIPFKHVQRPMKCDQSPVDPLCKHQVEHSPGKCEHIFELDIRIILLPDDQPCKAFL